VTHITLSKKSTSKPSLEFYSDGTGEVRRVTIEHFPFRIGRSESADLRVDAVEISREHAEIVERNGMWLVRDLGSTNGTQVNGKPIKETLLADGDILKLAETELTFVASASSQFQRMVTQPVQSRPVSAAPNTIPAEVAATRMLCEATLWQVIPMQIFSATSMRRGVTEAFFAQCTTSGDQKLALEHCHEMADRYRELMRMRAVERATARSDGNRLFLPIEAAEIESPHKLLASITQIQELMPDAWELGITISIPVDVDILRITSVHRQAKDHGLLVAFDQFQGNGGQVMHFESLPPDYLVLDSNMTKDVTSTRQPLRRLESLLAACEDLDIKAILPTIDSSHVAELCQEIGFDLILQSARREVDDHAATLVASA
jgi:pSer/pThr/pTyr-binding forkhead associated (FHA) protein/EAL domain-containing protein (putative c-di-GMP-specific phosphodiesterase class I)